jgi:hypothetical protein
MLAERFGDEPRVLFASVSIALFGILSGRRFRAPLVLNDHRGIRARDR